ncbi:hypothetical protein [Brachybacterium paraconglomeratum]|nr:hypothetical protein [Brachybacterium paraconglomeratum]
MTADPQPWLHESGSRHAEDYEALPGVVIWTPRTTEQIEKEKDR